MRALAQKVKKYLFDKSSGLSPFKQGVYEMCRKFRSSVGFLGLFLVVAGSFLVVSLSGCGGGGSGSGGDTNVGIPQSGVVSNEVGSVNLGAAGNFALLAQTGVDTLPTSSVTGNVGVSPAARDYLTGWSETAAADASDVYATSDQVAAPYKLYAANYAEPTPTNLTAAVLDMGAAYTDAASRVFTDATYHNIAPATLGTAPLAAGVYTWDGALAITTDVTLDGAATDVWIIQVGDTLDMAADLSINLSGGALPQNVFWQVAGGVTVGARSHFEGVVLSKTAITFGNLTSINGRLLAQSAININATAVTVP
jgi:hypothetical protein